MANTYLRNSDVIEMVGRKGSLRVVGRGGSLTSKTVDVSILDDVYKDYAEGNSPIVRAAAWKWYTTVVRTRLHKFQFYLSSIKRYWKDSFVKASGMFQFYLSSIKRNYRGVQPCRI